MAKYAFLVLALCLSACGSYADEDLRAVPVTNNPNLLPKSSTFLR